MKFWIFATDAITGTKKERPGGVYEFPTRQPDSIAILPLGANCKEATSF